MKLVKAKSSLHGAYRQLEAQWEPNKGSYDYLTTGSPNMYYTQVAKQPKVMSTTNNQANNQVICLNLALEDERVNNLFHNSGCDSKMDLLIY